MATYRLMDGASGRPGNGPATASAYSGNYITGTNFEVTQGGMWLTGYWWWVCNTGQDTPAAQKFALWQRTSSTAGTLVPNSTATAGTLTAGAWNYTALATPLPLSINCGYTAVTAYAATQGFPELDNQFGTGNPYASGITNGPLFGFGSGDSTNFSAPQCVFDTTTSDPTAAFPTQGFANANFWMDLQVTDQPPAGTSYRLWPNQPVPANWQLDTPVANWTLATEFKLSQSCTLNKIWFYSPAGVTQLPTETGIFLVSNQSIVAGTHNTSPSWSGAAASGWVSVSYTGVTLPAGDYKVAVCNGAGAVANWSATTFPYWADATHPAAPGQNGITTGPLSAPNDATATAPGQSTYQVSSTLTWPGTYATGVGSATYWVDAEVTPPAAIKPARPGNSWPTVHRASFW